MHVGVALIDEHVAVAHERQRVLERYLDVFVSELFEHDSSTTLHAPVFVPSQETLQIKSNLSEHSSPVAVASIEHLKGQAAFALQECQDIVLLVELEPIIKKASLLSYEPFAQLVIATVGKTTNEV